MPGSRLGGSHGNRETPLAAATLFTEDVEYRVHAFSEPYLGPDGVRAFREDVTGTQEEISVRMGRPFVDGDHVAVEFWTTLVDGGVKTTLAGCLLLQFAPDGRCERFREYWFAREELEAVPHEGWGE